MRTPNVVVEFNSPSTRKEDSGVKKDIYEQILQVGDYFCFDPFRNNLLNGWHLHERRVSSFSRLSTVVSVVGAERKRSLLSTNRGEFLKANLQWSL
jgi:Uma2 family endonuclease